MEQPKSELMAKMRKARKKLGFKEMWVHPDLQKKVQDAFDKTFKKD